VQDCLINNDDKVIFIIKEGRDKAPNEQSKEG